MAGAEVLNLGRPAWPGIPLGQEYATRHSSRILRHALSCMTQKVTGAMNGSSPDEPLARQTPGDDYE